MSKYALAKSWDGTNITTDYSKSILNIKFSFKTIQTLFKALFAITVASIVLNGIFKPFGGTSEPVSTLKDVSQLPSVNNQNIHSQLDLVKGLE